MKFCKRCERILSDVSNSCIYCKSSEIIPLKLPKKSVLKFSPISEVVLGSSAYMVEKVLAKGGFGYVLRVKDTSTGKRYAMKTAISMSLWLEPMSIHKDNDFFEAEKMLGREIEILSRLEHPSIVSLVAHGYLKIPYRGEVRRIPSYLMPLAVGDVEELMANFPYISLEEKIKIIKEVASALAYLHRIGIVYRDLGLKNILIMDRESQGIHYLLSDFGTIKESFSIRSTSTKSKTVGTPRYLDPIYLAHTQKYRKDPRIDVYSLGVVATEIFMGIPDWTIEKDLGFEIITAIDFYETVVRPAVASGRIPLQFEDILLKSTTRNIDERFKDAEEFLYAFYDITEEIGVKTTNKNIPFSKAENFTIPILSEIKLPLSFPSTTFRIEEVTFNGNEIKLNDPRGIKINPGKNFIPTKISVKSGPSFYSAVLLPNGTINYAINIEKAKEVLKEINSFPGLEDGKLTFRGEINVEK